MKHLTRHQARERLAASSAISVGMAKPEDREEWVGLNEAIGR